MSGTVVSLRGHLGEQIDDGAITSCVLLEHPLDQRCPLGVNVDCAVLASLLILLAYICARS